MADIAFDLGTLVLVVLTLVAIALIARSRRTGKSVAELLRVLIPIATVALLVYAALAVCSGMQWWLTAVLFVAFLLGLYINLWVLLRIWNEPSISFRRYLMMLVGK